MDASQINACAALVENGDPDRFLAAMAAPVDVRGALFTLYAFNLELARAPWVTQEPLIAQMRLQFWRDVIALEEFKAHEVAAPLQELVKNGLPVAPLAAMIDAREVEIGTSAPFDDDAALWSYLEGTGGALMQATVAALGGGAALSEPAMALGTAQGLANYLMAIPALEGAGRHPLPDGRPEQVAALAAEGLRRLSVADSDLRKAPKAVRPALRAAWRAKGLLQQAQRDPGAVGAGTLGSAEIMRRGGIILRVLLGK
ncbi:squalene/phytoene synthase family protein [Cereibacter sphaeroides]|nr:squalene/phytoene synthase family protein [Cereibacter sphaeroides]